MDNRITEFAREQRIAIARVISDLIMADKIIDDKEIRKFSNLFGNDNNRNLFRDAQGITLSQALNILTHPEDSTEDSEQIRKLNNLKRKKYAESAANVLIETANSDGICTPSEAVILLCIDYFLRKNDSNYSKYSVQSFQLTDLFIGDRFILYADNSNNTASYIVEEHYELIVNLLASIGYQFIYIPKLVEQYKSKGLDNFKTMAMYIFPDISETKVEEVFCNILGMTTKKFIQEYLNEKLGFDISCPTPAFMVMLGRSSRLSKDLSEKGLPYETYANFLKININNDNVLNVISDFVSNYNKFVSFNINVDFNPAKEKLLYRGIHKTFFRMIALAKENPNKYHIDINTSMGAIFINDHKINLPLGITAIYALILYRSHFGDKKGLPMKNTYNALSEVEQEEIQMQYETICGYLRNQEREKRAQLYPSVMNRISVIKNELEAIVSSKFIGEIQLGVADYVRTIVTPDHVTVNGVKIAEHPRWSNI